MSLRYTNVHENHNIEVYLGNKKSGATSPTLFETDYNDSDGNSGTLTVSGSSQVTINPASYPYWIKVARRVINGSGKAVAQTRISDESHAPSINFKNEQWEPGDGSYTERYYLNHPLDKDAAPYYLEQLYKLDSYKSEAFYDSNKTKPTHN